MGHLRPYESKFTHWLEILNEFTIRLLLLCLLVCQTEFVEDISARSTMGWVFIGVIVSNVVVNFGIVAYTIGRLMILKFKGWRARRKARVE